MGVKENRREFLIERGWSEKEVDELEKEVDELPELPPDIRDKMKHGEIPTIELVERFI